MRALDTNVVLRLILRNDAEQYPQSLRLLADPVFIPMTVLLETSWVLRSFFKMACASIAASLTDLFDIATVYVDDPDGIAWAVERYRAGADLPDMLHLVASQNATSFATFDRKLSRAAGPDTPLTIETLRNP